MAEVNWGLLQIPNFADTLMQAGQMRQRDLQYQEQRADRQLERERTQRQDARVADQDKRQKMVQELQALQGLATGIHQGSGGDPQKYGPAFDAAIAAYGPLLELSPEQAAAIRQKVVSDPNFVGTLAERSQKQLVQLGNGGVGTWDPNASKFETIREPTPPPVMVGQGVVALDRETGQPVYSNPKTFAPKRGGSGGMKLPSGFILDP